MTPSASTHMNPNKHRMTTPLYGLKPCKTDAGFANEIAQVFTLVTCSFCVWGVGAQRVRVVLYNASSRARAVFHRRRARGSIFRRW